MKSKAAAQIAELLDKESLSSQLSELGLLLDNEGNVYQKPKESLKGDGKKRSTEAEEILKESRRKLKYNTPGYSAKKKKKVKEPTNEEKVADILGEDLLNDLRERYRKQKENQEKAKLKHGSNIIWQPHEGPQTEFLSSPQYEVGFFGGRGSGKSDCLLMDPVRFLTNPHFRGLIIRRTIPALRELLLRARDLYPQIMPGSVWKEQAKVYEFPSGATLEFGYFDHMTDYDRYHGRQFCWLGLDEISQYESQEYYEKIKSVVRSIHKDLPVRVRSTTNPSGPGRVWIRDYFGIKSTQNTGIITSIIQTPLGELSVGRKYIKSTIFDNPSLIESDPHYVARLSSLSPALRKQWLEGDFDASDGMAFEEFDKKIHTIKPFRIPSNWIKIRAIDWGFRSKAVCLWLAVDHDGNVYVYRELVTTGVHADEFAREVLKREQGEYISYGVVDGSIKVERGTTTPTVEDEFINEGLFNIHADRTKGSRVNGKLLVHKYLRINEDTGQPSLKIFDTCEQLIRELGSLLTDIHNAEDVNTKMEDHAYDALRYGLSSQPEPITNRDSFMSNSFMSLNSRPLVVDSKLGY